MADWTVTLNGTLATTGGSSINNQTVTLEIHPEDADGNPTGAYLTKENFKIGGSTETASGSCIWEATGGSWNVDPDSDPDSIIDRVEFQNGGISGEPNNYVKAVVTFANTTAPNVDTVYNLDIDENPNSPIQYGQDRQVCFQLWLPYIEQEIDMGGFLSSTSVVEYDFLMLNTSNNENSWNQAGDGTHSGSFADFTYTQHGVNNTPIDITRTLLNPNDYIEDGYYKYQFSGTIPQNSYNELTSYDVVRLLVRRASFGSPNDGPGIIDGDIPDSEFPSSTLAESGFSHFLDNASFDEQNMSTGYFSTYNTAQSLTQNFLFQDGFCYLKYMRIRYNPQDEGDANSPFLNVYPDPANMCDLGHRIVLDVSVSSVTEPEGIIVSDVQYDNEISHVGGSRSITVIGSPGAEYELNLQKMTDLDSNVVASTSGYYRFTGVTGFQDTNPYNNNFTIPSSGRRIHYYNVPSRTTDCRYDVFLRALNTTTLRSNVPSAVGDRSTIQRGIVTASLVPRSESNTANYEDLTTDAMKINIVRSKINQEASSRRRFTTAIAAAAVSNSTRLTIERPNPLLETGMYVMLRFGGSGIAHETTISSINGNIITLSANATITSGDELYFERKNPCIVPFAKTVNAASGAITIGLKTGTALLPHQTITNLASGFDVVTGGVVTNSADIVLRSTNKIVVGQAITGENIIGLTGQTHTIIKSVSGKTITVDAPQVSIPNGTALTVIEDPDATTITSAQGDITVLHVQGRFTNASTDQAHYEGYLYVRRVHEDITLPVNLDTLFTAS